MIRRLLALAGAIPLALLLWPASAGASASTSATVTFTEADGVTPMANATAGIFYMTPAQAATPEGTTFTMTQLASGTTDSAGRFQAAVDTASIPAADLGDIGNGTADSFNAVIEAIDPSGNFAATWMNPHRGGRVLRQYQR